MSRSERLTAALNALKSESMPLVVDAVVRANASDLEGNDGAKARAILAAIGEPFVDALCVVMYAGRDEFVDEHPYDEFEVDTQFSEWWDYLGMEEEHFAREQMAEKAPLGRYLRRGAYMFGVTP